MEDGPLGDMTVSHGDDRMFKQPTATGHIS